VRPGLATSTSPSIEVPSSLISLVRAAPSPPASLPAALCKAEALIVPAMSILMWNDLIAVPLESAWVIIELGSLG